MRDAFALGRNATGEEEHQAAERIHLILVGVEARVDALRKFIELEDGQLRFVGLISIALGMLGLMLLQYA